MINIEQPRLRLTSMVMFGLASLSGSGLAGAHGAPDAEGVPEGIVQARITHQPDIPGFNAVILDAPRPGIMLSYKGEHSLTVLGSDQEDFLRFRGSEVMGNPQSPSWQAIPNNTLDDEKIEWVSLSQSSSFAWMDPRLSSQTDIHQGSEPEQWSIPVKLANGEIDRIAGTLSYQRIRQE